MLNTNRVIFLTIITLLISFSSPATSHPGSSISEDIPTLVVLDETAKIIGIPFQMTGFDVTGGMVAFEKKDRILWLSYGPKGFLEPGRFKPNGVLFDNVSCTGNTYMRAWESVIYEELMPPHQGAIGNYVAYAYDTKDTPLNINLMQSTLLPDGTCIENIEVPDPDVSWAPEVYPAYKVINLRKYTPPFRHGVVNLKRGH